MDDIINQKFNRLLVLSYKGKTKNTYKRGFTHYYLCRCDCGKETTVDRGSLRYGSIKSCGCLTGEYQREKMRIENDLSGKIFGRLTVLGRKADNFKKFECLCECGNITFVGSNDLKTSHTRSCGCLFKEVSSKHLHEFKMRYRESLGKDPLEPLGRAEDLERARFRLEMQQQILQRDDFSCLWCSTKGDYLHVHHLQTWKSCPERRFDATNVVTLCRECHKDIHYRDYHKEVNPIMTILLEGYSRSDEFLTEYHLIEKAYAARTPVTPN